MKNWTPARYVRLRRELARMERRLHGLETDDALRLMLHAHIEFLDHLTLESGGFTNFRTEFTTWYLTHRPKGSMKS